MRPAARICLHAFRPVFSRRENLRVSSLNSDMIKEGKKKESDQV